MSDAPPIAPADVLFLCGYIAFLVCFAMGWVAISLHHRTARAVSAAGLVTAIACMLAGVIWAAVSR